MKSFCPFRLLRAGFALSLLLCLASCKDGRLLSPRASGRPYEVLVVMDTKAWESPTGRALFNVLDTDLPGLPQPERSFHISQTSPQDYNRTLKLFRNIIEVNIDPTQFTVAKMKFVRNLYAEDQVILRINAPSDQAFVALMQEERQEIIDFFTRTEINRLCAELKDEHSGLIKRLAMEGLGVELLAPKEMQNYKRGKDFLWATNNAASGMTSICLYSYPYGGPETFNKRYILHKRDSVMQRNMPGSEPGMFIQTDTLYTDVKPIMVHGAYAMEARGLWYMRNDAMGGPFVAHYRVDTKQNRVYVAEGFVFAPEKMKRGLIRRVEGALYTLMLPQELEARALREAQEAQAKQEQKNPKPNENGK